MRVRILPAISLLICVIAATPALAHKLLVSATSQGEGALLVQAFFPDGAPAQEIPVTVTPQEGPALTGRTDNQGRLSLTGLKPGPYRVAVGDALGHRTETKVVIPGQVIIQGKTPAPATPPSASAPLTPPPATAELSPQAEPIPWTKILAGLGFIFGLTAFLMVIKLKGDFRRHASGH